MKAWKDRNWSWDIEGCPCTTTPSVELAADVRGHRLRREGVRDAAQGDAAHGGADRQARRDHGQVRSGEESRLVVDEWGAWLAPDAGPNAGFLDQQNSQRDAIIAALNLNIFASHAERVRMANIAQMVNVLQAMILTDKEKMLLTPTYHVFRMYVPFQDATFVPVTFDAGTYAHGEITLPRVDAIAAKDKDGKLWFASPMSTRSGQAD